MPGCFASLDMARLLGHGTERWRSILGVEE
jgi:hypothetical protein